MVWWNEESQSDSDRFELTPAHKWWNGCEWNMNWIYTLQIVSYAKMVIIFVAIFKMDFYYYMHRNSKLPTLLQQITGAMMCIQIPKLWKIPLFSRFTHFSIFCLVLFLLFMHSTFHDRNKWLLQRRARLIFAVQDHSDTKSTLKHQQMQMLIAIGFMTFEW